MRDARDLLLLLFLKSHREHLLLFELIHIRQTVSGCVDLHRPSAFSPVFVHTLPLASLVEVPFGCEHETEGPVTSAGIRLGAENEPLLRITYQPLLQIDKCEHVLVVFLKTLLPMSNLHLTLRLEEVYLIFQFDCMD